MSWRPTRLALPWRAWRANLETPAVILAAVGLCLVAAAFVGLLPVAWLAGTGSDLRFVPLSAVGLLAIACSAALAALSAPGDSAPRRLVRRVRVAATVPALVGLAALADLVLDAGVGPAGTARPLAVASAVLMVALPAGFVDNVAALLKQVPVPEVHVRRRAVGP